MKTKHFKQFLKRLLAALFLHQCIVLLQPSDEVVAIVDNSVILKSDLEQGVAEADHQMQAQKKKFHQNNTYSNKF
jgi:peptidyl-prolyl cis-trans isomerase SurA